MTIRNMRGWRRAFGAIAAIALAAAPGAARAQDAAPAADAKLASIKVPEGFKVESAASPDLAPYPMCAAFDDAGRLYVTASNGHDMKGSETPKNPVCSVYRLEDKDGDGVFDDSIVFAAKLSLPMGAQYFEGSLYVASPPEFLKFTDADGDGVAEKRETILQGWNVKNTASLHGPFLGPDGWLYLTHGRHGYKIETKEGETLEGEAARLWRCLPDGSQLERICGGGFDNPVELDFTPAGELIGTMTYFTDPRNGQRDGLMHWVEGGVYPKPHEHIKEFTRTGDLMPTMTKFARIAPAGLARKRMGSRIANVASAWDRFKGGLFSAQFNPHRVQFHALARDGATFKTVDEDFLVSTDPDFHPTDVIEDADGSLLVIETGGWYVDACPLSKISKPDIRGGIYRVREAAPPAIPDNPFVSSSQNEAERKRVEAALADPRGSKLDFAKLEIGALAELAYDQRIAVRDRALEELSRRGEGAIDTLTKLARGGPDEETRCGAAWALSRMQLRSASPASIAALRELLWARDAETRCAAARACGMARDKGALDQLMHLARYDEPQVRRVACAALARIGDPAASEALLESAARATDRFAEHAAIDALIEVGATEGTLFNALSQREPARLGAAKAALIAMDQMGRLKADQFKWFLGFGARGLEKPALWVASRHAEWAGEARKLLEGMLREEELSPESEAVAREALASFSESAEVQAMAADLLDDRDLPDGRRRLIVDCIERSPLKELPESWIAALRKLVEGNDDGLRLAALGVARTRRLAPLKGTVDALAGDAARPVETRLAAIGAAISLDRKIGDEALEFLLATSKPGGDAARRLSAAQCLSKAELSPAQLARLAGEGVASADALTLPAMLAPFESATDESVGAALVEAALRNPAAQGDAAAAQIAKALPNFPEKVRASAAILMAKAEGARQARTARLAALEPLLGAGDVGRGRRVFYGAKAACSTCHAVGNEGGDLAPDLTAIGKIRSGRDILEALVFPNSTFVPGYEPMRVETDRETLSGVLGEQTADAVVVKTGAGASTRVAREAIKSMEPSTVSLMPEGLETALTQEELADLLAFLQSQNGEQWLQPVARETAKK